MAPARRSATAENDALIELRTLFARDFPELDLAAVRRVLRRHRLSRPPAGLLLERLPRDRDADAVRHAGDHPLFSLGYYLAAHPDVAAAGVPAWLHYQVFGRVEGRPPHPFVNVAWLREALPDVAPGLELDRYLADRSAWFAEPGPYTEAARFALSGLWSTKEAPLVEIVRSHSNGPWVHHSLMLIDLAGEPSTARLAAVSSVLGAVPEGVKTPTLAVWSDGHSEPTGLPGPYVVVPGYFAGAAGVRIWSNRDTAVSPDRTAVATRDEVVTVTAGPRVAGSELVLFTSHAGRADLSAAIRDAVPATVFAPSSKAGEVSLRQLSDELGRPDLKVLSFGAQATVSAERIELRSPERAPLPPAAPADIAADARGTAIVLPLELRNRAVTDPRVRDALVAGAALCLIDGHGLQSWLPVIQNRARVVVAQGMAEAVGAFIDDDRIVALDGQRR